MWRYFHILCYTFHNDEQNIFIKIPRNVLVANKCSTRKTKNKKEIHWRTFQNNLRFGNKNPAFKTRNWLSRKHTDREICSFVYFKLKIEKYRKGLSYHLEKEANRFTCKRPFLALFFVRNTDKIILLRPVWNIRNIAIAFDKSN